MNHPTNKKNVSPIMLIIIKIFYICREHWLLQELKRKIFYHKRKCITQNECSLGLHISYIFCLQPIREFNLITRFFKVCIYSRHCYEFHPMVSMHIRHIPKSIFMFPLYSINPWFNILSHSP